MNWEAIQGLGEVVSAVAVVISSFVHSPAFVHTAAASKLGQMLNKALVLIYCVSMPCELWPGLRCSMRTSMDQW